MIWKGQAWIIFTFRPGEKLALAQTIAIVLWILWQIYKFNLLGFSYRASHLTKVKKLSFSLIIATFSNGKSRAKFGCYYFRLIDHVTIPLSPILWILCLPRSFLIFTYTSICPKNFKAMIQMRTRWWRWEKKRGKCGEIQLEISSIHAWTSSPFSTYLTSLCPLYLLCLQGHWIKHSNPFSQRSPTLWRTFEGFSWKT